MMTSLRVIGGLGPPNQKSWLRLWYTLYANDAIMPINQNLAPFLSIMVFVYYVAHHTFG